MRTRADGCCFVEVQPEGVVETLNGLFPDLGDDKVQAVGAVYRGVAGIDAVNAAFHARNAARRRSASRFAVGDPVIWTVNDYDRALWNGSMGRVLVVHEDGGLLALLDGREVAWTQGFW